MSTVWILLQRDVFGPIEERLLEMAFVWKSGRKRKVRILCIVVSAYRPLNLTLVKLKKVDRDQYKRNETWFLYDLRLVDGKDAIQETPDFDLQFDKLYRWTASSFAQKNTLLSCIWKLNTRHLSGTIRFTNVSPGELEDLPYQQESEENCLEVVTEEAEEEEEEDKEYQEITLRESADMLRLMEDYAPLVANAEAFTERLSRDLQGLDEANLQCIISSEQQVALVMQALDEGLDEAGHMEESLNVFDRLLQSVKEQMDDIHEGNSMLQLIDANRQKLTDEILFVVDNLDLGEHHCKTLNNGDFTSSSKLKQNIAAVEALSSCMSVRLNPEYRKMHGVAEQLITFESLRQNFEKNFVSHLTQLFEQLGADQEPSLTQQMGRMTLPTHIPCHHALLPYTPLMTWLQDTNVFIFNDLPKVYIHNLSRLYEREIKAFFEVAKTLITKPKEGRRFSFQGSLDKLTTSTSSLHKSYLRLTEHEDIQEEGSEHETVARALDRVLNELAPMCVAEQNFITSFFMLNDPASSTSLPLLESPSPKRSDVRYSVSEDTPFLESNIAVALYTVYIFLSNEDGNFDVVQLCFNVV
ncbi:exocyst complex component 1-like [Ambystoma mexicanum]|uniref:exocyst complex component 1-like n=1 Tax=Ambystoma mexicanum TaxID=8296 RepID=UPI0037E82966